MLHLESYIPTLRLRVNAVETLPGNSSLTIAISARGRFVDGSVSDATLASEG